jgi:ribonuclease P protein component
MAKKQSFRKFQKLHTDKDFRRVYIEGRFFSLTLLEVYYVVTANKYNRLGVVVMSRHLRKASERIKLKRWLREIFRTLNPLLKQGYDFVVKSKITDLATVEYHALEGQLRSVFRNEGIFGGVH